MNELTKGHIVQFTVPPMDRPSTDDLADAFLYLIRSTPRHRAHENETIDVECEVVNDDLPALPAAQTHLLPPTH